MEGDVPQTPTRHHEAPSSSIPPRSPSQASCEALASTRRSVERVREEWQAARRRLLQVGCISPDMEKRLPSAGDAESQGHPISPALEPRNLEASLRECTGMGLHEEPGREREGSGAPWKEEGLDRGALGAGGRLSIDSHGPGASGPGEDSRKPLGEKEEEEKEEEEGGGVTGLEEEEEEVEEESERPFISKTTGGALGGEEAPILSEGIETEPPPGIEAASLPVPSWEEEKEAEAEEEPTCRICRSGVEVSRSPSPSLSLSSQLRRRS